MLHELYNLTAREKKKKIISVVQANSKVTCTITSLWVLFGLACQHFISYYVSVPVPTMFPSPVSPSPHRRKARIQRYKICPKETSFAKSMFKSQIILGDPGPVSRDGRKGATKVFEHRRKSPWVPTLARTISKRSSEFCLLIGHKKCFVRAQSVNSISWVLFLSSYTTAIDSITTCLAHAPKKCTQSGNFQFDINSPFQNTVYPKTKDAFPKIQAWAYNRYSRLHRSHLSKY